MFAMMLSPSIVRFISHYFWYIVARSKENSNRKENVIMGFVDISMSEKVWEVLYASTMLSGQEREEALRKLNIPTDPRPAA